MPALGKLVVVDEFGVGPLCPTLGRRIDLIRKYADGDRDLDASHVEETCRRQVFGGVPVELPHLHIFFEFRFDFKGGA